MSRSARVGAVIALVALAGCGESAEERFRKEELRPLAQEIEREQTQLAAVIRAARPERRRDMRAVRASLADVATTAKRIAALRPPESARDELAGYVRANSALVRALDDFATALPSRSDARLGRASERARDAAGAVSRAKRALEAALTD